jgi:DNA repair protein REV1
MPTPRTTKDDPGFVGTFFANSRLHFIGSWKERYAALVEEVLPHTNHPLPKTADASRRVIFHVDMDAFFASVAVVGKPELATKPVAVCWASGTSGGSHSEISSCNYIARADGVKAGMWMQQARALCPGLVAVPYDFERFADTACIMYRALFDVSPHVLGVSVDEAYIDVSTAATRESPELIAARLRQNIEQLTGGCTASIGIGSNRLLARLATKEAKPDGVSFLRWEQRQQYLDPLAVRELPGVGRKQSAKLEAMGVRDCRDLRLQPLSALQAACGRKTGSTLHDYSRGFDKRPWPVTARAVLQKKSVGAQITWGVR